MISESAVGAVQPPVCSLPCSRSYDFSPDVFVVQHVETFEIYLLVFIIVLCLKSSV